MVILTNHCVINFRNWLQPLLMATPLAEFGTGDHGTHGCRPWTDRRGKGWLQFVRATSPQIRGLLAGAMSGEVFQLHVLPAGIGDALVLDYGTADVLSEC